MGGLILFSVLGLWAWFCFSATRWSMSRISSRTVRFLVAPFLFLTFFALPVADELVARPQFNALCKEGAVLKIDAEKIKGRTVRVKAVTTNKLQGGTAIPILHSHLVFEDVNTHEELGAYERYTAKGGLMAQLTGFPEGHHPWTFQNAVCEPEIEWKALPKQYGFTLID